MLSALFKAFTGRAGFLASLLALALLALTAAAVLLNLPRIEQKLLVSSQSTLVDNLAQGDVVENIQVDGRTILLQGQFQDEAQLAASLEALEGVREVVINAMAPQSESEAPAVEATQEENLQAVESTDAPDSVESIESEDQPAPVEEVSAQTEEVADAQLAEIPAEEEGTDEAAAEPLPATVVSSIGELVVEEEPVQSVEAPQQIAGDAIEVAVAPAEDTALAEEYDESSLAMRYDGLKLQLSGHLADEQMAKLIVAEVRNAIPPGSELEVDVDGQGTGSPLHWMNEFLVTVARLPDDAQGLIQGSDTEGVSVIPDAEQTLRKAGRRAAEEVEVPEQAAAEPVEQEGVQEAVPQLDGSEPEQENAADQDAMLQAHVESSDEQVPEEGATAVEAVHPGQYIVDLNKRLTGQDVFESGEFAIGASLAHELDGLVEVLKQNPELLLRVVGNLDFTVEPRFAEFVGIDRAREVRDYLHDKGIEPFRVFATPLPREYAYDKRIQLVFYISE